MTLPVPEPVRRSCTAFTCQAHLRRCAANAQERQPVLGMAHIPAAAVRSLVEADSSLPLPLQLKLSVLSWHVSALEVGVVPHICFS